MGHVSVMALALIGGSFLGGATNKVPAVGIFLKLAWRFSGLLLIMLVFMPFYFLYIHLFSKNKVKIEFNIEPKSFFKKYLEIPLLLILTNIFLAGW